VNLRSVAAHGLFSADMMAHALQCIEPDRATCFCLDAAQTTQSRHMVLDAVADTLVMPALFPGPTAGHVVANGNNFRFRLPEG